MKSQIQTRRTERLALRPMRDDDIDALLVFRNEPQVYEWLLTTTVEPVTYRETMLAARENPRDYSVVAELDGTVIGTGSLELTDAIGQDRSPELAGCQADIGYVLAPAYAGKGLATEIARELLAMAFDDLEVRRVTAGCYADNVASARVLEKIGMRREEYAVEDSWHHQRGWIDGATYAILRTEWRARSTDPRQPKG